MKATASWRAGFESELSDGRGHRVRVDLPLDEDGTDHGTSSLELSVLSLAGCIVTIFALIARRRRLEFRSLEVELEASRPPKSPTLASVDGVCRVATSATPEAAETVLRLTLRTCPVGVLFERAGVPVHVRLETDADHGRAGPAVVAATDPTIPDLAYVREYPGDAAAAVRTVTEALGRHGFGVLASLPIAETLRARTGTSIDPITILEVCSPAHALRALEAHRESALLLPCKVVVSSEQGATRIAMQRPTVVMRALLPDPALAAIGEEVEQGLRRAIDDAVAPAAAEDDRAPDRSTSPRQAPLPHTRVPALH